MLKRLMKIYQVCRYTKSATVLGHDRDCPVCEGLGKVEHSQPDPYSSDGVKFYSVICKQCKGMGRIDNEN